MRARTEAKIAARLTEARKLIEGEGGWAKQAYRRRRLYVRGGLRPQCEYQYSYCAVGALNEAFDRFIIADGKITRQLSRLSSRQYRLAYTALRVALSTQLSRPSSYTVERLNDQQGTRQSDVVAAFDAAIGYFTRKQEPKVRKQEPKVQIAVEPQPMPKELIELSPIVVPPSTTDETVTARELVGQQA